MAALQTERLLLTHMTEQDLDFLADMLGDPKVMRHFPNPLPRAEAQAWLDKVLESYLKSGRGFYLARLRASGEPIGQIGLIHRDINGAPELEVAYMLHHPFWARGLATEGAAACRDHAFGVLKVPRVVSMIHPANEPSLRVAARLGMQRIGETTHRGMALDLYGIDSGIRQ
jgi:RimJ/RimL family protein N-acetyltransferase